MQNWCRELTIPFPEAGSTSPVRAGGFSPMVQAGVFAMWHVELPPLSFPPKSNDHQGQAKRAWFSTWFQGQISGWSHRNNGRCRPQCTRRLGERETCGTWSETGFGIRWGWHGQWHPTQHDVYKRILPPLMKTSRPLIALRFEPSSNLVLVIFFGLFNDVLTVVFVLVKKFNLIQFASANITGKHYSNKHGSSTQNSSYRLGGKWTYYDVEVGWHYSGYV